MNRELSSQEKMFLDRMAEYLIQGGGKVDAASIEQAGKQVLSDDCRLVNMIMKNDKMRDEAKAVMGRRAYRQIRAAA